MSPMRTGRVFFSLPSPAPGSQVPGEAAPEPAARERRAAPAPAEGAFREAREQSGGGRPSAGVFIVVSLVQVGAMSSKSQEQ